MRLRNTGRRYGIVAQALHWTIALLIFAMFGLGWYMQGLPLGMEAFKLFNLHKSLGLVVVALVLIRLAWRLVSPPPPLPAAMAPLEKTGALVVHLVLYGLMFLQPASGLVMSFASGLPTIIFGTWPLPSPIPASAALKDAFAAVHFWSSWAIAGVVALHVLAALRHHFLVRDDVLRRMLPEFRS